MSDFNENNNNEIENEIDILQKNAERPTEPVDAKKKLWSSFIDYIELFAVAICVVLVLFTVAFRTCTVDGDSMNNTLLDKETLIISDFLYTAERGDIIVFHQTGDSVTDRNFPLVKRVIGVAGDTVTVDVKTWTVTVKDKSGNTTVLDEPYIYIDPSRAHMLSTTNNGVHTFVVPEGTLFVLGDNRNNSLDSTNQSSIGFVDERRVLGKVILRVSPVSKFGTVD